MVPRPKPESPAPPLIPQFFAGREVFITGATGFMGKVLVERLLWTCPDISRLHLLMRCKKDIAPEKRLAQLKQSQVFDMVRQHCPQQLDKLTVAVGDVTKHSLGMDALAISHLKQVSVVFHSAASVKFTEPLAAAVQQNLRPIISILDVCDQLPNMQVLVHVSTAYCNTELPAVEERVYDAPAQLDSLLALVDAVPEEILAEITPKLISPKPNTYTFTKAMAESVVAQRATSAKYASAIFRPTIVIPSLRHPFPGWIDNANGPTALVVGVGKGLLHVFAVKAGSRADLIPVDICIDTLIAVAWETAVDDLRGARVYNCSSYEHPTTWGAYRELVIRGFRRFPFDNALWYPFIIVSENAVMYKILATFLHTVPLYLIHYICRMCGIKPRPSFKTISHRLHAMHEAFRFFSLKEWRFSTDNVQRLRHRLSPLDGAVYNLDPKTIDWEELYTVSYVRGARKYLLRERDEDIERARRRMQLLYLIHHATRLFLAFFVCRLAIRTTPAILRTIAALLRLRRTGTVLHA